jgi:DNA-binding transcriptional MerR regulator
MIKKGGLSSKDAERIFAERDLYAGIVLEDIHDQLSIVIEGNEALEHKIDRHYGEFQEFRHEINEKIDTFSEETKSLRDAKANKKDVTPLEHRVARLEEKN